MPQLPVAALCLPKLYPLPGRIDFAMLRSLSPVATKFLEDRWLLAKSSSMGLVRATAKTNKGPNIPHGGSDS